MNELERCRPWIESALEYSGGTHTFDDIVDDLTRELAQFWPAPRGCLVTQILTFPRKKVLHIFLAAGDLDQLLDMHDSIAAWGRAQGCSDLTMSGRKGWERALKQYGCKTLHVSMTKEL